MNALEDGIPINLGKNRHGRVRVVTAPRGSLVAYETQRRGKRLTYVIPPGSNEVIALTADGRVHLGRALQSLVAKQVFGLELVT